MEVENTWRAIEEQTDLVGIIDPGELRTHIEELFSILNTSSRAYIIDLRRRTRFIVDTPIFNITSASVGCYQLDEVQAGLQGDCRTQLVGIEAVILSLSVDSQLNLIGKCIGKQGTVNKVNIARACPIWHSSSCGNLRCLTQCIIDLECFGIGTTSIGSQNNNCICALTKAECTIQLIVIPIERN